MLKRIRFLSLLFIVAFVFQSGVSCSQTFTDTIITIKSDTLLCRITLINKVNIFYSTKQRKKETATFISLDSVSSYKWNSKDLLPVEKKEKFIIPFDTTTGISFGIKLNYKLNYPVSQEAVHLSMYYKGHNIFIGPAYIQLLDDFPGSDPVDSWVQNYWGLSFGYRYLLKSWNYKTNFYAQAAGSVFEGEFTEYQKGPPYQTDHMPLIIEYNLGIGVNQKLNKNFMAYTDMGLGAFNITEGFSAFYFMLGVEYRFIK